MPNFDDLFTAPSESHEATAGQRSFNKDEFKARKQAERDNVYGLIDSTTEEMKCSGELFQTFLDVQARFDRYSPTNAILIAKQLPGAMRLADFDTWKAENVRVNKGEKSIAILEPGKAYTKEDGTTGTSFNVKRVFDISQTNSAEKIVPTVTRDERLLLKSLITHAPCQMKIGNNMHERMNAIYSPKENTIYVRQGMDAPDIFRALSSELAHAHMAKGDGEYKRTGNLNTVYCVSYVLCKRYGVPTDSFAFERMPEEYAKLDNKQFREELTKIRDVAGEISHEMNRVLDEHNRSHKDRGEEVR